MSEENFIIFSIENFRKVYFQSEVKQYLSGMDNEQLKKAIEDKDEPLLKGVYDILMQQDLQREERVQKIIATKNKYLFGG
jgi:predicted transcriptional regulator